MATLTDTGFRRGGYIVSEGNGYISRETVTVDATGGAMDAGTILGKITATGKYIEHVNAAVDGSEVAVAILYDDILVVEDVVVITARDSEVNALDLTYDAGGVVADIDAELAAVGIIVR